MKPGDPEDYLVDRKFAAKFLGGTKPYSAGTLAVWDCTKRYDLRPVKMGRDVRYWYSHLLRVRKEGLKPAYF
ncbi:excisionase [Chitinophaga sp. MD30]|nr:excisionase [Chitinophaga sp. MD30]